MGVIPNGSQVLVHTNRGILNATIFDVYFGGNCLWYWITNRSGLIPEKAIEHGDMKAEGYINIEEW